MKNRVKIFLWVFLVASTICIMVALIDRSGLLTPHHTLAKDPNSILKITGIPLPHICRSESSNNLLQDRPEWVVYKHTAHFAEPLNSLTYNQLDSLCNAKSNRWSKNATQAYYQYTDNAYSRGRGYSILCHIYADHSYVEYSVDKNMYYIPKLILAMIMIISITTIITWAATLIFIRLNEWANAE